jgi:hypothetical protein
LPSKSGSFLEKIRSVLQMQVPQASQESRLQSKYPSRETLNANSSLRLAGLASGEQGRTALAIIQKGSYALVQPAGNNQPILTHPNPKKQEET